MWTAAGYLMALAALVAAGAIVMLVMPRRSSVVVRDAYSPEPLRSRGIEPVHEEAVRRPVQPAAPSEPSINLYTIRGVRAGRSVVNVPVPDLSTSSTAAQNGKIAAIFRIDGVMPTKTLTLEFAEMFDGTAFSSNGSKLEVYKRIELTPSEITYLEQQRDDGVKKGDKVIEDFRGKRWNIKRAFGEGSMITNLAGTPSCFAGTGRQSYMDIKAEEEGSGTQMLMMYVNGAWNVWMGRVLVQAEIDGIQVL
jgi:hypothetical protein